MADWTMVSSDIKEGNDTYVVMLRGEMTGAELATLLLKKDQQSGKFSPDFGEVKHVPDEVKEAADKLPVVGP